MGGKKEVISYYNIKTNNLKGIDFFIEEKKITTIYGDSGSGKSSLAFNTISRISEDELSSLIHDENNMGNYVIESYNNILVTIPLQQINKNVNPYSTISTYFMLQRDIERFFSYETQLPTTFFRYNAKNFCETCNGLGYIYETNVGLLVDKEISIYSNPFFCWKNSYKELFRKLIIEYCNDIKIDYNKKFFDLSIDEQNLLLNGISNKKYSINYTISSRKRVRTLRYIGPIKFFEQKLNEEFNIDKEKYSKLSNCPKCNSSRYNSNIRNKKISSSLDFEKFYIMTFRDLYNELIKINIDENNSAYCNSVKRILKFLSFCNIMNLGYLNFSRSIPSLSGGELQRLRLCYIFCSKLSNTLVVLDEPSASLSKYEIPNIIKAILSIKENNTLLIVEHNSNFLDISDNVYCLGPCGGEKGGYLVEPQEYFKTQSLHLSKIFYPYENISEFEIQSDFINFQFKMVIYHNTFSCIVGESGCGKTTLLKEISIVIPNCQYISQKPLHGNSRSTIGSYLGISDDVKEFYSNTFNKSKSFFSIQQDGGCQICKGKGEIQLDNLYGKSFFCKCEKCNGTGYDLKVLNYNIGGLNIYNILNLPIDKFNECNINLSSYSKRVLEYLNRLGISYLSLNRKIDTLSGGENQRVKLAKQLAERKKTILALDEPTKGLSSRDIGLLLNVIYEEIKSGKTFICVDHNSLFYKYSSYILELKRNGSNSCLEFIGNTDNYK